MSNSPGGDLLTADEVAEQLRINTPVVWGLCRSKQLRAYRVGKAWRIERSAVREYLEATVNTRKAAS